MNLADARLAPSAGADGLVCRTAGAALFIAARTPAADVAHLVERVTAHDEPAPARQLAREMATLVGTDTGALPGFALVATSEAGIYVKAYGAVEIRIQGEAGEEVITSVGSFTGVDREVTGSFHSIAAHRAGEPVPAPVFDIDLRAGTAPGGGFSLTTLIGPTDAPIEAPPAAQDDDTAVGAEPAPMPPPAPAAEAGPPPAVLASTQAWSSDELAEATAASGAVDEVPADGAPSLLVTARQTGGIAGVDERFGPVDIADLPAPLQAFTRERFFLLPTRLASTETVFDAFSFTIVATEEGGWARSHQVSWTAEPDTPPELSALFSAIEGVGPSGPLAAAPGHEAVAEDAWVSEAPPVWDPPSSGASAEEPITAPPRDQPTPQPPGGGPSLLDEPATMPPTNLPASHFTSQLLGALDEEQVEERAPLPVDLDPSELRAPDQATQEIMVQGILCSRGHFNDPRSRFCSSCGISMVQNTQVLTPGPRPPLGVMVFEDGATFSLSQDYVVGRQPEVSELVRDGLALPLPVDDPERSISRAHAELRLVDWDVHLINLSATNGSFVWDETQQQWIPIPTGQSVLLAAGMRVALGRRSAVFESSLVR